MLRAEDDLGGRAGPVASRWARRTPVMAWGRTATVRAMVKIRLDPADEYMHALEDASNFNESMYFNVYDPKAQIGGFFRLGNRANEGKAEMTTCVYLPDGRVAFMFDRPAIDSNDAFDAGGMRFDVVEPFEALTVAYDGKAIILEDPLVLADPRRAFTESPWSTVQVSSPTVMVPVAPTCCS